MSGKANAFTENDCELCGKKTYWYQSSGEQAPGHCLNHSNWKKGVRHAVPDIVQGANLTSTKLQEVRKGLSELELRNANKIDTSLWQRTTKERENRRILPDVDWANDIREQMTAAMNALPDDKNALNCFQCGKSINQITSTAEVKPRIKRMIDVDSCYTGADGKQVIVYKDKITAAEVRYCNDCCLSVRKPISVRTV